MVAMATEPLVLMSETDEVFSDKTLLYMPWYKRSTSLGGYFYQTNLKKIYDRG